MRLRVDDWPVVIDEGVSEAVTPAGVPLTASASDSGPPSVTAVVMVDDPEPPWARLTADGAALIEKSFVLALIAKAAALLGVPSPVGPS